MSDVVTAQPQAAAGSRKAGRLRMLIMFGAPILIAIIAVFIFTIDAYAVLPRLRPTPGFALADQQGNAVSSADLYGDIVVLSSGDPRSLEVLAAIQQDLRVEDFSDGPGLRIITLPDGSTDPAQLQAVAEQAGVNLDQWTLLAGDPAKLETLSTVAFPEQEELLLIDDAGFVRAEYSDLDEGRAGILNDVRRVFDESTSGGFSSLAYDVAHKFNPTCHAR